MAIGRVSVYQVPLPLGLINGLDIGIRSRGQV
jgi:hypothetical protein